MTTSKDHIRRWFECGKKQNATHMLVVFDTFDYEDYPVYVLPGQDVHKIAKENSGPNMTKLMEVYSYKLDLEDQLNEHRSFHYD